MRKSAKILLFVFPIYLNLTLALAEEKNPKPNNLTEYLVDQTPTSVSAANLLGAADVTNIQNPNDIGVILKALGSDGTKSALALSFTPARSAILPMDITSYSGIANRLIGALTFGYAQGDATISGLTYSRQAFSLESNIYIYEKDDPISILRTAKCNVLSPEPPSSDADSDAGQKAREDSRKSEFAGRWAACKKQISSQIPWNAATFSFGYAKGYIKPTVGTSEQINLGETLYVGITMPLGPKLEKPDEKFGWQLQAAYRRSENEPDISTLGTNNIIFKNSSITYFQIKGGTTRARGLIQISNVKVNRTSTSTGVFKRAVGIDYNVQSGIWIIFRLGKKQQIDNGKEETSSMLTLNISPTMLLK